MLGRMAVCAAAFVLAASPLLVASPSSARGAHGAHAGAFHHHGPRHNRFPYGYAYLPLGTFGSVPEDIVAVSYPLYVGPRCTHSVERVTVPAESGGLRRITITRC